MLRSFLLASMLGLTVAVVGLAGCTTTGPSPEEELVLRLSLVLPELPKIRVDQTTVVTLRLRNTSGRTAKGCLVSGLRCSLRAGRENGYRTILSDPWTIVDHPRCTMHFRLKPGDDLELKTSLMPLDFPLGGATLSCQARLSSGLGCHPLYGCNVAVVEAEEQQVVVRM